MRLRLIVALEIKEVPQGDAGDVAVSQRNFHIPRNDLCLELLRPSRISFVLRPLEDAAGTRLTNDEGAPWIPGSHGGGLFRPEDLWRS
eukprot:CAMPEP_0180679960 /NCGR_PEP_ID=MMETSP1037_2-20121125/69206_1 /TAXON_ID=632150 /ORGANISM="Azadinium spinosum, Strain 3D9" /LENGTH=87 /DNA_ID=CAMNT_0022709729 /DNA_START=46 /DNA_END=306 /DNA_ORIENTATION=-